MTEFNEENENYSITKLDETTWLVIDKTKNIPSPHYYKTFSTASNKCRKILNSK